MMVTHRKSMLFDLPSGTRLGGKYELLRKLATGGMAEIYLARTSGAADFEKLVVIKRILPTVADDPNFVQMFLDEARLAARLRHPNIADVYEVGEDDGAPFFAMEFLHGQDIRAIRFAAHARKEAVPLSISLAIIYGTASALDYAHELTGPDGAPFHLVHRDVSASNVLVGYEGAVKLIDFGIARASSRRHQTQVGTLKGKIPYMSPEQCRGERLDRRSDLFSLGVVMYELTTGRRPFVGDSDFSIMDQIVHHAAPPPSQLVRGYPPELEAIVMRLLARRPDERYPSAEALLHDLDPYIGQHRLYVSAKSMSKYMRALFEDRLAGFEDPDLDEGTRAQRLLATITAESQNSQLLTPISSFPEPLPASQEMPAVGTASEPFVRPSAPVLVEDAPAAPPAYPEIRPRGRRIALVLLGIAALGIGGFVGLQLKWQAAADAPERPASAPPAEARPAEPPPAANPSAEPGAADPDPAEATAGAGAGESTKVTDVIEIAAEAGVADDRKPAVADVGSKPRTTVKRPPPKPAASPRTPPRQPVVKAAPPKETPPPTTTTTTKPPDRPKDPSWDKNDKDSPFLPR